MLIVALRANGLGFDTNSEPTGVEESGVASKNEGRGSDGREDFRAWGVCEKPGKGAFCGTAGKASNRGDGMAELVEVTDVQEVGRLSLLGSGSKSSIWKDWKTLSAREIGAVNGV